MDKDAFNELLGSVQEMDAIVKGEKKPSREFHFPKLEVKAIRARLGVSQDGFAMLIGVSKRTVENWEQGRRAPAGTARSLLRIMAADPEHALRTLRV